MSVDREQNRFDVATVGGGHGQSNLMWALGQGEYGGGRVFGKPRLVGVVTMMDDGGSSGVLREAYGVSAAGDPRMLLSPLAPDDRETELYLLNEYRFRDDRDQLAEYTVGSLIQRAHQYLYDTPFKRDIAFQRTFGMDRAEFDAHPDKYPDLAELMAYRFENKGLSVEKANMGNLILAALELKLGSFKSALTRYEELFGIEGKVLPVTYDKNVILAVRLSNGHVIDGESNFGNHEKSPDFDPAVSLDQVLFKDPKTGLEKDVEANPDALDAIANSKFRVVGPGSLHTSVLPTLKTKGVGKAFAEARERGGRTFVMMNPMNQELPVEGAEQHLLDLERNGFDLRYITDVVLSKNGIPPSGDRRYRDFGQSRIPPNLEACRDLVPWARVYALEHILRYDRQTGHVTHDLQPVGDFFAQRFFEDKSR